MALESHPTYKLILAANRDEFYERPTAPLAFWNDAPDVLGGRDLLSGGTWLGITRKGRIAAVTNFRDPASEKPHAPSRGDLVKDYLVGSDPPSTYLTRLDAVSDRYNGFNLLVGTIDHMFWYSNRDGRIVRLSPGVHGICNHLLNTPWPKVDRGIQRDETDPRRTK
ncbi:MAG: NRDE family protein [Deltaproteobacteria bacterium]|nr:NRDE family protein [Deltaproteobacteria bacterium]